MSRILVVDDAPEVAGLTRLILEHAGFAVRVASGGRDALAALSEQPADVVILDLEMPDVDGWEVLRRIRLDPAFTGTRVILYSGAVALGITPPDGLEADASIPKGIPAPQLVATVRAQAARPA